jgi:hypothetical protein
MDPEIKIIAKTEEEHGWSFNVELKDEGVLTQHIVTVDEDSLAHYAPDREPEELVLAAFKFLLDQESPDAILPSFSIADIPVYFPEFEDRIRNYA